jgi:hypothetical protein
LAEDAIGDDVAAGIGAINGRAGTIGGTASDTTTSAAADSITSNCFTITSLPKSASMRVPMGVDSTAFGRRVGSLGSSPDTV